MRSPRARTRERAAAKRALDRPGLGLSCVTSTGSPHALELAELPLVEHPVIPQSHPTWYRTLRPVLDGTGLLLRMELIGEHKTEVDAMVFCATEKWRALVVSRENRNPYSNGHERKMESHD